MTKKYDHDKPKTEVKKRFERKRYLNVIYFIDSNRTRTLKFSIGTSYFTVGLLSAAVIWSVVSASLLVRDRIVISRMQDHTQSLLELVFNYQTRYDEVYEKAYPDNDSSLMSAVHAADLKDEKAEKAANGSGKGMSLSAKTAPAIAREKLASETASSRGTDSSAAANEPPISIENFSTQVNEQTILVRVSLKNLSSPNKTSGSVKAVAKFIDLDNKPHSFESHPKATGDETRNDEQFNIRYFKNKAFYFEPPKGVSGKFIDLVVTIKDGEGRSKDFPYPLNKEFIAKADKPQVVQKHVSHVSPAAPLAPEPTPKAETNAAPPTTPVEAESKPIVKTTEPSDGPESEAPSDSSN